MKKRADLELLVLGIIVLIVAIIIPTETEACTNTGFGPSCIQTIYTYDGVSASTAKAVLYVVAALCIAGGIILLILRNLKQSKTPTGQRAATITSAPITQNTHPAPIPPGPVIRSHAPPSSLPSSPGTSLEKAARAKRRTLFLVILGSIILVVVITGVWVSLEAHSSPSGFQQSVTTGSHITSIEVGTGISNSGLQGQGATFTAGSPSCISFTINNGSSMGYISAVLSQGSTTVFSGSVPGGEVSPYYQGNLWICSQYNILNDGVYQWVVNYNGSPEASITFQIVN